ncbi:yibE/F-like family protein [Kurthia sibirica]|uniref:YibE/F-like family protein n=2 Tax=Kurthia sibirica TaxID=202750 RepID=A0A2U3AP02_9BACL|nr:yibE/F-like family protein [Kurthia sibirica]
MSLSKKLFWLVLICCVIASFLFVHNNYAFYDDTIVAVTATKIVDEQTVTDRHDNMDKLFTQYVSAVVKNGSAQGDTIRLTNNYSKSQAFDEPYKVGDELFVTLTSSDAKKMSATITGVKRDKYLLLVAWILAIVLLLVGKKQGFSSLLTLLVNAVILSFALDLYITQSNQSLLWISAGCIILFTILSLLFVNGRNKKTAAAIIATLLGTFSSLLITYLALTVTSGKGLRYEELQFITRPYEIVFMAGLFIGALGAVMDVAITMSTSMFSLYDKDPTMSIKALKKSGLEIGKDIMGTMTNVLFFAYVSGSIPMLILYFKNTLPFGYTLSVNLSLEIVRALAGGLGIVLTIPLGLYSALFFIKRQRAKL